MHAGNMCTRCMDYAQIPKAESSAKECKKTHKSVFLIYDALGVSDTLPITKFLVRGRKKEKKKKKTEHLSGVWVLGPNKRVTLDDSIRV